MRPIRWRMPQCCVKVRSLPSFVSNHKYKYFFLSCTFTHSLSLSRQTHFCTYIICIVWAYTQAAFKRRARKNEPRRHISSRPTPKVVVPIQSNWFLCTPPYSPSNDLFDSAHWLWLVMMVLLVYGCHVGNCYYDKVYIYRKYAISTIVYWECRVKWKHLGGGHGWLSVAAPRVSGKRSKRATRRMGLWAKCKRGLSDCGLHNFKVSNSDCSKLRIDSRALWEFSVGFVNALFNFCITYIYMFNSFNQFPSILYLFFI